MAVEVNSSPFSRPLRVGGWLLPPSDAEASRRDTVTHLSGLGVASRSKQFVTLEIN